jgi:hypothetical protein
VGEGVGNDDWDAVVLFDAVSVDRAVADLLRTERELADDDCETECAGVEELLRVFDATSVTMALIVECRLPLELDVIIGEPEAVIEPTCDSVCICGERDGERDPVGDAVTEKVSLLERVGSIVADVSALPEGEREAPADWIAVELEVPLALSPLDDGSAPLGVAAPEETGVLDGDVEVDALPQLVGVSVGEGDAENEFKADFEVDEEPEDVLEKRADAVCDRGPLTDGEAVA